MQGLFLLFSHSWGLVAWQGSALLGPALHAHAASRAVPVALHRASPPGDGDYTHAHWLSLRPADAEQGNLIYSYKKGL